jgi:hypothetical protein
MSMSNTTKRVKEIRCKTRRKFSSEEKIRIVLDGLRGESSKNKTDFNWHELHKLNAGNNHFPLGGFVLNLGETLLVGFNEVTKLEPSRVFLDEFDNVQSCGHRVDTELYPIHRTGRPKGSKNRLSEYFLFELADHFEKYGREAIERICEDSPGEYLRIIASLIPKELILEQTQEETVRWVINASSKALTEAQWRQMHGLDRPEHRFIESDDS